LCYNKSGDDDGDKTTSRVAALDDAHVLNVAAELEDLSEFDGVRPRREARNEEMAVFVSCTSAGRVELRTHSGL